MTKEEIKNTAQWKITEKGLKKEFPYILKIDVAIDKVNAYDSIYLIVYIDPFVFIELYGKKINPYYFYYVDLDKDIDALFLQTIFGIKYDEGSKLSTEIVNFCMMIQSALPSELKIKVLNPRYTHNYFSIEKFVIPANLPIPKDLKNPPGTESFHGPYDAKYFFTTTDEAFNAMKD